ncbi:MAG: 30S ribosome-binding factor RbfA [Armatimonadetes bacterium]|nr:30S ribosome-binding factor RbfA [Armatimonadota bacterium]
MSTTRQRRVQELLIQEISDILRREIRDPRVGFVTVTDAEVSPDLRHARVFYTVLGDDAAREGTAAALKRAAGFIRSEFARRAQMRFVPEIRFAFDTAVARGARIHELLEETKRDELEPAAESDPGSGGD